MTKLINTSLLTGTLLCAPAFAQQAAEPVQPTEPATPAKPAPAEPTPAPVAPAIAAPLQFTAPAKHPTLTVKELEGPTLVDYDADGKIDLISGNYNGNIIFRKNTGTNAAPVYAAPTKLKSAGEVIAVNHW